MSGLDPTDREAFERDALGLLEALYRFARWLTRNETDARDLVQDTYLLALRSWRQFQPGTNLRAWLFRIARNRFVDTSRRQRREPFSEDLPPGMPPEAVDPAPFFGDHELARLQALVRGDLARALVALPEPYRSAVVLADVEGWTWEEVAGTLGVPIGTVQSRVFRGRRALRTLLKDYAPC